MWWKPRGSYLTKSQQALIAYHVVFINRVDPIWLNTYQAFSGTYGTQEFVQKNDKCAFIGQLYKQERNKYYTNRRGELFLSIGGKILARASLKKMIFIFFCKEHQVSVIKMQFPCRSRYKSYFIWFASGSWGCKRAETSVNVGGSASQSFKNVSYMRRERSCEPNEQMCA